ETATAFLPIQRTWRYDDFGSAGALEGSESVLPSATLRGGWNVGAGFIRQFFRFDPAFYASDSVIVTSGATVDTVPFAVPGQLSNLFTVNIGVTTPVFRRFSGSVNAGYGAAAIFPEAVESRETRMGAQLDWRPMGQVRISVQYTRLVIDRAKGGSRFSTEDIPRLKLEYQASRAIFFRFVGQYTSRQRAALMDGQGQPIVVGGTVVGASTTSDFRTDWLFSYRPSPGTLIYLGYGSSRDDDFRRLNDGVFAKVSYLFRL
ncbi:MAG: hypothetical protein HYR48_06220, partial [Gemmatimonadetes bacterium]|nr:hypothetical protein [Gemmatimonadota bacterium]